jgi:hypothetical protein
MRSRSVIDVILILDAMHLRCVSMDVERKARENTLDDSNQRENGGK